MWGRARAGNDARTGGMTQRGAPGQARWRLFYLAGRCPPPWHPRVRRFEGSAAKPKATLVAPRGRKTHSGGLDHFRRTGQYLFYFHRDAIAADVTCRAPPDCCWPYVDLALPRKPSSIMAPRPKPQDLMDRHRGSAKHDEDVEIKTLSRVAKGASRLYWCKFQSPHCFTTAWLRGR